MAAPHSKSLLLYEQMRRAMRSGRLMPGQRIDPATLADEFDTSDMPARLALYRLVGRGLLDHHVRGGMHLPLPTEFALRDRYAWMQHLLGMACDIAPATFRPEIPPIDIRPDDDPVERTWQLFDAIGRTTGRTALQDDLERCNDWLAPIRQAKRHLIDHTFDELARLSRHWQRRELPALKTALDDYHRRRIALVPCIVATLREQTERLG